MDNLYIATEYYAGKVQYEDGTKLSVTPTVVLYNRASREKHIADIVDPVSDGHEVSFSQEETATMQPGTYDMEVYINYPTEDNPSPSGSLQMVAYQRDAVKAIEVSVSLPEEESSAAEESSSSN